MNLRDLEYLVALAEHRHFGRAAQACFVSQPTLSTQLKKLEEELGVALIERSPRNVMLTHVGEQVLEIARQMLKGAERIRDIAKRSRDPESGSVRMGLFPTLGPYLLPHVVPRVKARFPHLELLLVEEKTEQILNGLSEGRLDAGIIALPVPDENLHAEPLFEEDFLLAVPKTHPLAKEEGPVPSSVMEGERLLLLEDGHCLRDQALEVCAMTGAAERSGFRATSLETLRQMVSAGVGLTLLPRLAVEPPVPRYDDIRLLSFEEPPPHRRIAMVWRKSSPLGDFLPRLAAELRELPEGLVRRSLAEAA